MEGGEIMGKVYIKVLVFVSCLAVLAGCATATQRQAQEMRANIQSASVELNSCLDSVYNSHDYNAIRDHLPTNVTKLTLQQLTDTNYITDEEKASLFAVEPPIETCRHNAVDKIGRTNPTYTKILLELLTKYEFNMIALIEKKQSWGDFTRNWKADMAVMVGQISDEDRRLGNQMAIAQENELTRRQAYFNALAQYSQTQQIINSLNRPVVTNCMQSNRTINCISQ